MGFDDQEIVALSGAHSLGFCHDDRSGFVGKYPPWPCSFEALRVFTVIASRSPVYILVDGGTSSLQEQYCLPCNHQHGHSVIPAH